VQWQQYLDTHASAVASKKQAHDEKKAEARRIAKTPVKKEEVAEVTETPVEASTDTAAPEATAE
jgi:hypothetical protein